MTAAFDHVTLLAVRIAAARLDPAVDSETFVWLLQRFAAAIVRDSGLYIRYWLESTSM